MIFGQFGDMVKQARELKANLDKVKGELSRARYEVETGGVKAVFSGEMELLDLKLPPNPDANRVKEAINQGLKKAKDDAADKLKGAAGGMNIPGLT